jgi:hypothetical protein
LLRLKVSFYKESNVDSTKSKRVSTISNKLKRKAYLTKTKIPKKSKIQFTYKDKKQYQIKGIKSFALSPHKNDWQLSYLPLSKTALIALITHKRFINSSYAPPINGPGLRRDLIETANVFAYSTNNKNLIDFSKVLFPFSRYRLNEINRISTNGEIVDIYFERNVTKDGVIYEKKQASRFTSSEKKKAEKKEPPKVIVIDSSIHRESSNKRRKRLKKLKLKVPFKFNKKTKKKSKSPPQSSNLVLVGVDPGAKTLATAVSYGQFDSNVKKRNNTSDRDKSVVDRKDPAFKSNSRQFSYSSKQYYHDTKVNERNRVAKLWLDATCKVFKNEAEKKERIEQLSYEINCHMSELYNTTVIPQKQIVTRKKRKKLLLNLNNSLAFVHIYDKLREHELTAEQMKENGMESIKVIMNQMKSNKTGNIIEYIEYLRYVKKYENILIKYNSINTSRKWEFNSYRAKQMVYDKLHQTFKDCVVGYGNYSQPGSSKIRVKSKYLFYIFYFKVF